MKKSLFGLFFLFFLGFKSNSQLILPDSTNYKNLSTGVWTLQQWTAPNAPEQKTGIPFVKKNADWKFILAIFMLLFIAIFKLLFPKYFTDLFAIIFKSSLKSKQIKDQLESKLLPSILLNIFFTVVFGVFSYLIIQYYQPSINNNTALIIFSVILFIGIIYMTKYLSILFFGWLFGAKETASSYIFIVFFFNKIMGIILLPIVIFLLLNTALTNTIILIALFIISLLILYRYILSYISIKKNSHLHPFHFFLYLCTLEIMPLLLIYKGVMVNYSKFL